MQVIGRKEAKDAGRKHYFTGKPCPQGHISLRYVKNHACAICVRNRAKAWVVNNRNRYRENQRRYKEQNGDVVRAQVRDNMARNKDRYNASRRKKGAADPEYHKRLWQKAKERDSNALQKARKRTRKWVSENPGRKAQMDREWRKNNPEKFKEISRAGWINRRALELAAGKISSKDVTEVRSAKTCAACGILHEFMEIDHVVALSRGGLNHRSNLQLLCRPCNRSKSTKDYEEWLKEMPSG